MTDLHARLTTPRLSLGYDTEGAKVVLDRMARSVRFEMGEGEVGEDRVVWYCLTPLDGPPPPEEFKEIDGVEDHHQWALTWKDEKLYAVFRYELPDLKREWCFTFSFSNLAHLTFLLSVVASKRLLLLWPNGLKNVVDPNPGDSLVLAMKAFLAAVMSGKV